jgi:cobaltochelatase CobN
MHRVATLPGGWNPQADGVVFIDQTPAPIVVLTAADTDIQVFAQAYEQLPADFPEIRVASILALQQQLTIDEYAENVLQKADVILIRLLGGTNYWSYGLEIVLATVRRTGAKLIVIPGDDQPDPELSCRSTLEFSDVNQVWQYFIEGGVENIRQLFLFLANRCLKQPYPFSAPQVIPKVGLYPFKKLDQKLPQVGIIFYRAHYLAANMAAIDALCQALVDRQLAPVPVFVSSLRDLEVQAELLHIFQLDGQSVVQVLLNTTSFSLIAPAPLYPAIPCNDDTTELWKRLDVPVLQVILSSGTQVQWQSELRGLSARDTAINVALPEVDGRIISRAISFKTFQKKHGGLQTQVTGYEPALDRVHFVADLACAWASLRRKLPGNRKVALILANYPNRDGRLANGVGLDTPASCVEILKALRTAGYHLSDIPETGEALVEWLVKGVTNDPEANLTRPVYQSVSAEAYTVYFQTLSDTVQQALRARWGEPKCTAYPIPGIQLGNIFVGIQPARGYDLDPSLNYHASDLEPTHDYLAFYYWVRSQFQTDAILHVGKHGNLEWLPGKSIALSEDCYPEVALGPLPHLYPFIVNDPGEGSQAKRRAQAVIIDHLTPPMTRSELYGDLQDLENLVDEYYEALSLDPSRTKAIQDKIVLLLQQSNLNGDLGISLNATELRARFNDIVLSHLDRSLCEIKEAQIRDGLHILGQCPAGTQLRDLAIAIARSPQAGRRGLTRAIAEDSKLDFDPLSSDPAEPSGSAWRTVGQAIESIEIYAMGLVESLLGQPEPPRHPALSVGEATRKELNWMQTFLLPALRQTDQEILAILHGLEGGYIESAPSGAPTRGRPEVLPTGRNFYSVDIRAVPTMSAWDVGRRAAETLVERYTQENGEYPETLGLSIWGTSTMRTGGDDLAQALALIGVQPVWDNSARRVVDFEILPIAALGRPRVDVTLRISGFFRDAFPNLIDLFDQAVIAVSGLQEPEADNPLAASVRKETAKWIQTGLEETQAMERSRYRIFGSKPGAYGAGLQGLIESQQWQDDGDLARAYTNWSSYAYTSSSVGKSAPEAFAQRLQAMEIVLQNQDNREHDLLDSDDYYQFQGGMTAAVRALTGQQPTTYFGDNSQMENPRVRTLKEEIAKVYRSRVVNPKWIAGAMRHGYKGAFEMAATADFLFAYDVTAQCVEDHMYRGVAEAYLLDLDVQAFMKSSNPWALRDIAERLLEANQRGFWSDAEDTLLEQIRAITLEAEGVIENQIPIKNIVL